MTKDECVRNLTYLVGKYVDDVDKRCELLSVIEQGKDRPPAKGVIYSMFALYAGDISEADKTLIDDIGFYFG